MTPVAVYGWSGMSTHELSLFILDTGLRTEKNINFIRALIAKFGYYQGPSFRTDNFGRSSLPTFFNRDSYSRYARQLRSRI